MISNGATAQMPESLASPWTGRLEFELRNARGWGAGTAEVVVRLDTVSLRFDDRELAVMRRDVFGGWLRNPSGVYEVDSVAWSRLEPGAEPIVGTGVLGLVVDGRSRFSIDGTVVSVLGGLL